MNRREFLKRSLVGIVIGSIPLISSCEKNPVKSNKLRMCPDAWYINKMPSDSLNKEYLIVNGEVRNVEEFDIDWIKNNCKVNKPTEVW